MVADDAASERLCFVHVQHFEEPILCVDGALVLDWSGTGDIRQQQRTQPREVQNRPDPVRRCRHCERTVDLLQIVVIADQDAYAGRAEIRYGLHIQTDVMGPASDDVVERRREMVSP